MIQLANKQWGNDSIVAKEDLQRFEDGVNDVATPIKKGLMSHTDKSKLNDVEQGANNYKHPTTHPATMITPDANNRFVSDTEKVTWNAKSNLALGVTAATAFRGDQGKLAYDHSQTAHAPADAQKNPPVASSAADGLMGKEDRTKLDAIALNANNYVHPSSHPASMIIQDVNNRFMTDAERNKLAGVATGANNYAHPSTHPASMIVQDTENRFMTDAERNKLAGIATGANNYSHPSTHPPAIIAQDINNRFATDAEKIKWNTAYTHSQAAHAPADAQKNPGNATSAVSGLMSNTDKAKLDGVEAGANKYLHPSSHPASMITQDASNRFMTDVERNKLNGIDTGANNYTHPATHPPTIIAQNTANRFVTDNEKSTWNAKASTAVVTTATNGLMIASDKTKLNGVATGAQVNAAIATQAIAEAGTDNASTMTALRVNQAIEKMISTKNIAFFTEFETW